MALNGTVPSYPQHLEAADVASLIGHVRTQAQHDAVVSAVWRGHAVMAVIDEIEITG